MMRMSWHPWLYGMKSVEVLRGRECPVILELCGQDSEIELYLTEAQALQIRDALERSETSDTST